MVVVVITVIIVIIIIYTYLLISITLSQVHNHQTSTVLVAKRIRKLWLFPHAANTRSLGKARILIPRVLLGIIKQEKSRG